MQQTDNDLMLAVRDGDTGAFGVLFDRYRQRLFEFFYRLSGDSASSEDLVQEVFLRMFKYRNTFGPDSEFRGWMYHIARTARVDRFRNEQRLTAVSKDVSYRAVISQLLQKYPNQLKYEYRHFPLTKIHPNALPAAMAAEAAGEQGRFWEMHERLLGSQDKWSHDPKAKNLFVDMARQLGLDTMVFSRSLESLELEQKVAGEVKKANNLGIDGTPTFFINGRKLETTPEGFAAFDDLLLEEMGVFHK